MRKVSNIAKIMIKIPAIPSLLPRSIDLAMTVIYHYQDGYLLQSLVKYLGVPCVHRNNTINVHLKKVYTSHSAFTVVDDFNKIIE